MIYWYEQLFYGMVVFALIHVFKFYIFGNEDIALLIYKYFREKK
jgi:hypothetical protein